MPRSSEKQKGGDSMKAKSTNSLTQSMIRYAFGTAAILTIPVVAMQISTEWDWNLFDFIIIGTLLMGAGFTYELIKRKVDKKYRVALAIAVVAAVLLIWVHLAVGIIDNAPFAGS